MAFIDSAAEGRIGPLRSIATATVSSVAIIPISPYIGDRITVPELRFEVSNTGVANSDVQVQVSTSDTFGTTVYTTTLTNVADGIHSVVATGLSAGVTYYWRARAADTGTTGWGPWSGQPAVEFAPATVIASAASSNGGAGFGADEAFDGDPASYWLTDGGAMPQWISCEIATPQIITKLTLTMRNVDPFTRSPLDWTFEGSTDGSTWDNIATFHTGGANWTAGPVTYYVGSGIAYEHHRLHITESNGDDLIGIVAMELAEAQLPEYVPWSFIIDPNSSRGVAIIEQNLGAETTLASSGSHYIEENVGLPSILASLAGAYVESNIGFIITLSAIGAGYIEEGEVNEDTPTPHIWFLQPDSGRPLDGVNVVGFGVGDLQTIYDGEVQIKAVDSTEWVSVAIVSWQTFPPTPDAYTPERLLDPIIPVIDMQHTVIGIVIPAEALPPGYQVRIRTDGP